MRTGPKQKPKAEPPGGHQSKNQPPPTVVQKGKANSYFANSRTAVHKNFDRHPHVGSKSERKG